MVGKGRGVGTFPRGRGVGVSSVAELMSSFLGWIINSSATVNSANFKKKENECFVVCNGKKIC